MTTETSQDLYGTLSPDGRQLTFYSNRTGENRVYVVERAAAAWSSPRQVSQGLGTYAQWLDNHTVIYGVTGSLRAVGADGAGDREIVPSPFLHQGRRNEVRYARVAPDGRTVFLKAADSASVASFWSFPATGGTPRPLIWFDDDTRPSSRQEFATDGKHLYFTIENRQSDIFVMELRTGP